MSVHTPPSRTIERTPPRRRIRRRSVWRKTVWPLVRLGVILTVVITVGHVVADKAARPFKLYSRESRETQRLAKQLDELRRENSEMRRRIKYMHTSRGVSLSARKLGWVKPGEITLVLPPEAGGGSDRPSR